MWNPSLILTVSLFQFLIILPQSQSCQKKHLRNFLDDGPRGGQEPEIHHHNYHHHYDQNGHEIPAPHPQVDVLRGGHFHGEGVEHVTAVDGDYPAKHVVVLQPAPPPPADEDFFDSIIPKKFHPKHILKHHIHKLRDRFRDLLGDDKKQSKHAYKYAPQTRGPPPPPQGPYATGKVALPALKVPLVQVEAYKPAPAHYHPGPEHPGGKAVAYISPDGYRPAVVVQQKPQIPHYPHHEPQPGPPPHHPPPPPQEEQYQYQPVAYEPPHPKPQGPPQYAAYPPPQQPVAYHPHPQSQPQVTVQVQPQVSHVTYSSPEESPYHQSQGGASVPVYGPQASHPSPYSPFGSSPQRSVTSYQHFGHGPTSSVSYSSGNGSPFSTSGSSSPFGDSSIFQ